MKTLLQRALVVLTTIAVVLGGQEALTGVPSGSLSLARERESGAGHSSSIDDPAVEAIPRPTPSWSGGRSDDVDRAERANPVNPVTKSVDGFIQPSRWIVELASPALAQRPIEVVGKAPLARPVRPRIDTESATSRAYLGRLAAEQEQAAARIAAAVPGSQVERRYSVVLNALDVRASAGSIERIRQLPGVRSVAPDQPYRLTDYPDVEQIGAPLLWQQAGGPDRAGAGVKIAIIDSGIYLQNPSFNPAGYRYPPGFPKGDTRATSEKVIAARTYFRPDDPPEAGKDTPIPVAGESGHGTHVAATAAGIAGTIATADGVQVPVSGVAPGAYLMNYRVFYTSRSERDFVKENAFTVELVAAIEDAVKDGADVINDSWGASYSATFGWADPMVRAIESAVAAGVVVVQAAGNEGPAIATANNPTNAPSAISVGAVTTSSAIRRESIVVTGLPEGTVRFRFERAAFGPRVTSPTADLPIVVVQSFAPEAACSPLEAGTLDGKVALVARGICSFVQKATNAQAAGAAAVIFVSETDDIFGPGGEGAQGIRIPVAMIGRGDGQQLVDAASEARLRIDPRPGVVPTVPDRIAPFSSRGPTTDGLLKPDVVAPGVDILAAGYGPRPNPLAGFGQISGTSMASPHVAGAVALLRQLHPEWTPAQIKSALSLTANPLVRDRDGRQLGTLERGAGRIDLGRAVAPALLAEPTNLGFGSSPVGQALTRTLQLTGVGPAARYRANYQPAGDSGIEVIVTPSEFQLNPGGAVDLTVQVTITGEVAAADYQGDLLLSGAGDPLRIPLWVRVVPERDRGVLLLDNDGSESLKLSNTAAVYRQALEALKIPYDIFDADEPRPRTEPSFPTVAMLQHYRLVILFTGSRDDPVPPNGRATLSERDQNVLADYLNGGGRILAAGRRLAEAIDVNFSYQDPLFGRSRLFHGYLGAVVRGEAPAPRTVEGAAGSPLAGRRFGLSVDGDLPVFDAYREDSDTYLAPGTVRPLLGTDRPFALFRASDPTPDESRRQFTYRSALLGFGLEDVAEADRVALLGAIVEWLEAEPAPFG